MRCSASHSSAASSVSGWLKGLAHGVRSPQKTLHQISVLQKKDSYNTPLSRFPWAEHFIGNLTGEVAGEARHGLVFRLEEILSLGSCGRSVGVVDEGVRGFLDHSILEKVIPLVLIEEGDFGHESEGETRGHCGVDTLARGCATLIFDQIYKEDCIGGLCLAKDLCPAIADECLANLRAEQGPRLGREAIIRDWFDVDRLERQLDWVTKLVRFAAAGEGHRKQCQHCEHAGAERV